MKSKNTTFEAVVLAIVLVGAMFIVPAGSIETDSTQSDSIDQYRNPMSSFSPGDKSMEELGPFLLDRHYEIYDTPTNFAEGDNDDVGTKRDAGDKISRSTPIFPGEIIDDTAGRGNTGKLSSSDEQDWFSFSVCVGQNIQITLNPDTGYDFDLELWDQDENLKASSSTSGDAQEAINFTAEYTGKYYMAILFQSGTGEGRYEFDVTLVGQNDANTGMDAGGTFADAVLISEGSFDGYLDMNDWYDWYKFDINDGDGIHIILNVRQTAINSDFDVHLYNPLGELVYEEEYYYDDELYYPADMSGEWRIEIDTFPGWDPAKIPQPTEWDYYTYGSGAYNIEFSIESEVPDPPAPIPQPEITPIAQTFYVPNDPDSNDDEYGYIAAIPASNYLEGGNRYLSPILYQGDDTPTNYYETDADRGTVDTTTQYLEDDWNAYLNLFGKTPTTYTVPTDPIEAAADIATNNWGSSDLAVVAMDGSDYEDEVKSVISRSRTLKREVQVDEVANDDPKIMEIGGYAYPMLLGPKWGAINVSMFGTGGATPSLNTILPHMMPKAEDWWPAPYDAPNGDRIDIYFPVTRMGVWAAGSDRIGQPGDWNFKITKYAGHRYHTFVREDDFALEANLQTEELSDLLVFLVDPQGHLRAPDIPQWNGPVNPIHVWNGFENPPDNPWRTWNPGPHLDFSAEVLFPEKGLWTIIVVPRNAEGPDVDYTLDVNVRIINPKRADAAISAANAAVIASQNHAPLLYVTEDGVPTATADALSALGVSQIICVDAGGSIPQSVKDDLPTAESDLTTMQDIVDYIKAEESSENYITITSVKSGEGPFAPSAMIAAYHGAPVLRLGDAPGNSGGWADRIETWRLWEGDFYHGSRSTGHLPVHDEPVDQGQIKMLLQMLSYLLSGSGELPPFGLDAKRYWNEAMHDGIYNMIEGYGLDLDGQEGYCFVGNRKDIYLTAHSVMMGNNSYAGHIPGPTVAYMSALINRNVLYPALIFANENRDITTTQMMNFPDGGSWKTNDGKNHYIFSSREIKKSFGSHFRTFEGHCLWDAHLERMNNGASAMYYSGHGTGGSGISAQYVQTDHCNYPEQVWWDSWRGYSYDNWKMPRDDGRVWYNAEPPNLYDIIHYDYNDQLFENLQSNAVFYMSCTTADADGPLVYLDHGAVCFYGNAGSGLCPEADLQDDEFFKDVMIHGEPIGPSYSKQVWLHFRDFTTKDPTSMYGSSSLIVTTVQCIYGDPNLIIYSPDWTAPTPIDA